MDALSWRAAPTFYCGQRLIRRFSLRHRSLLTSIIRGFGYSVAVTNLLTIPPFAVATATLLFFGHYSDKLRLRWPFILTSLLTSALGFGINLSGAPVGVKYFGTFLCTTGAYSTVPGAVAWFGGNVAGQYKRATALALYVGIGNIAGMVASNIYQTQDSSRYMLGHGVELGFVCMGLVVLPIMVFAYKQANARKEAILKGREESGGLGYTDEELRRMADKAPNFRYGI